MMTTQALGEEYVLKLIERLREAQPTTPQELHEFSHSLTDDLDTLWGLSVTLARQFLNVPIDYVLVYEKVAGIVACGFAAKFLEVRALLGAERLTPSYNGDYAKAQLSAARYRGERIMAGIKKDPNFRGKRVLVMDDVIDSGGTVLALLEIAEELGLRVVGVASIIARESGLAHIRNYLSRKQKGVLPPLVALVTIRENGTLESNFSV
jgi:adenine/guanine phosphoribosyltransferase-like PRPP-binding protein